MNKVSDTQGTPKNTFEQQIINKTKELSEDKITTKRPIVKDHLTKQLINANHTFDGGPYIVDNETGEVVSEAELKEDLHTRINLIQNKLLKNKWMSSKQELKNMLMSMDLNLLRKKLQLQTLK